MSIYTIEMRQRTTYLLPSGAGANPADIEVEKDQLSFAGAGQAAVETRTTVGLSELPKEVCIAQRQPKAIRAHISTAAVDS